MGDVFSDLFFGKIIPCEQFTPKTKEYQEACKKYNQACNELETRIKKEAPSLAQPWQEAEASHWTVIQMEQVAAFSAGFRLGVKLMEETGEQEWATEKGLKQVGKKARQRKRRLRRVKR